MVDSTKWLVESDLQEGTFSPILVNLGDFIYYATLLKFVTVFGLAYVLLCTIIFLHNSRNSYSVILFMLPEKVKPNPMRSLISED